MRRDAFWVLVLLSGCDYLIDWNGHSGFARCAGAIDAYPGEPAPPCGALHMCANEASLTAAQQAKLLAMIAATPGCEPP